VQIITSPAVQGNQVNKTTYNTSIMNKKKMVGNKNKL